jgi:hypothetical protein
MLICLDADARLSFFTIRASVLPSRGNVYVPGLHVREVLFAAYGRGVYWLSTGGEEVQRLCRSRGTIYVFNVKDRATANPRRGK